MTSRERFRETMRSGPPDRPGRPDRVPYFEEGLRDDVLVQWREQGLPPDTDPYSLFPTDRRERVPVNTDPVPPLEGLAFELDARELRRRLDPDDPARFPEDWPERVAAWRERDHCLELHVHRGYFLSMGVGGWSRFEPTIYFLKDQPRRTREIMEIYGEFAAQMAERVLRDVEVDYAIFSEPVGGNDGPLLSPEAYEEFVLESYQPALQVLDRHGVEIVVFMTFANARALVPSVLRYGFNCLWACEVNLEAMDYRSLRDDFGPGLRLIGGIDLDALLAGEEAIREEIETKVPPLLAQGGYVPLADGRVRSGVSFENYAFYRKLLAEVASLDTRLRRYSG